MSLLPCPFCGGRAENVIAAQPKHARYVLCVQCNNGTAMTDTPEQATELWNRRAVTAIAADAARYQWLRDSRDALVFVRPDDNPFETREEMDAAIDRQIALATKGAGS